MASRRGRDARLAVIAVFAAALAGCAILAGLEDPGPGRISLSRLSRLPTSWEGTWRDMTGGGGVLRLDLTLAEDNRLYGTVTFQDGCPGTARFEGDADERALILRADLAKPCGEATITVIESREPGRLTGSFRMASARRGLFVLYPR